jgi:hypothetical protein
VPTSRICRKANGGFDRSKQRDLLEIEIAGTVQPHFEKRLDRGVRQGPATDQPLVILLEAQQLYEADRAAVTRENADDVGAPGDLAVKASRDWCCGSSDQCAGGNASKAIRSCSAAPRSSATL